MNNSPQERFKRQASLNLCPVDPSAGLGARLPSSDSRGEVRRKVRPTLHRALIISRKTFALRITSILCYTFITTTLILLATMSVSCKPRVSISSTHILTTVGTGEFCAVTSVVRSTPNVFLTCFMSG